MKLTGAQALIKSLEMEGVEVMFGLPGGGILPVYDPIIDSPIRHILVRHEQGAGHMAEGYAHATGRPGVAMVTSGPAATNIVTPLCDAYMDSIPMVVITGQVPTAAIGTDAFQECDTAGITRSVTKHNELVMNAEDIPRVIREAFHIATTGRPGPVLVDIPKDVARSASMDWYWPESLDLPGYKPTTKGHPRMIREAAELILASERPVIYAGGGILKARGGRGAARAGRADRHPRRHDADGAGRVPRRPPAVPRHAGHARQLHRGHVDAEGRPADRARARGSTTGSPARWPTFAPDAKIIHVDIDPAELGKVRRPDVPIVGDCRLVIEELVRSDQGDARQRHRPGRHRCVEEQDQRLAGDVPAHLRAERAGRGAQAAVRARERCATPLPRTASSSRASASTRCGRPSTGSSATPTRG